MGYNANVIKLQNKLRQVVNMTIICEVSGVILAAVFIR